jgi:NAD(P)-dependent dehydrogenase (short-subunit alcohol dehydrogenase family)
MLPLEAKVALVTGGSSGIGRASALAFAREGATVVIADIDANGGNETVKAIRKNAGQAVFAKTDVSQANEVEALINKIITIYGRLDYAFNNAGIEAEFVQLTECTEEDWDRVIDINLKGVWLCMKYEIRYMVEHGGGSIVNTSSVCGQAGFDRMIPYSVSKHGIIGLTKCAALSYAGQGVRINAICPGSIRTPLLDRTIDVNPTQSEQDYTAAIPIGRLGTPADVAEAVVWLCSDAAAYITGQALSVDGGYLTGYYHMPE